MRAAHVGGLTSLGKSTISVLPNCKRKSSKSQSISGEGTKAARERTQRELAGLFPIKGDICSALRNSIWGIHTQKRDRRGGKVM